MAQRYPVLVIGGYDPLGQLISNRLAQEDSIHLFIAGHSERRAKTWAQQLSYQYPDAKIMALSLNVHDPKLADILTATGVKLVLQASGHFAQQMTYPVVQACLKSKIHYIDLASHRDYVVNIQQFNAVAEANQLLITSGAGLFPAMSSAVIAEFRRRFVQMDQIKIHASFGQDSGDGQDYLTPCGQAFEVWRNQNWETSHIGQDMHCERYPYPIGKRWMGLVNPPDLTLLPHYYPEAHTITAHASQGALLYPWSCYLKSWLRRYHLTGDWLKLPALPGWRSPWLWFGSDRSAIQISVNGYNRHGKRIQSTWYLLAAGQDTLHAMIIPALVLTQKIARQEIAQYGAFPCVNLIPLEEMTALFGHYNIQQTYRNH